MMAPRRHTLNSNRHRSPYLELLVEDPVAVDQLVGSEHLRLVPGHGVEDEEQGLLRKFLEVARLQPRRVVPVALGDLRKGEDCPLSAS